jgi:hypothetical protein
MQTRAEAELAFRLSTGRYYLCFLDDFFFFFFFFLLSDAADELDAEDLFADADSAGADALAVGAGFAFASANTPVASRPTSEIVTINFFMNCLLVLSVISSATSQTRAASRLQQRMGNARTSGNSEGKSPPR